VNLNDKIYFSIFLKENVIIFDVYEYIGKIASDLVDYMNDWGLVKNNKVVFKKRIIEDFIKKQINFDINFINQKLQKNKFKILFIFCLKDFYEKWNDYFEDKNKFINLCKKNLKKKNKQIFDIKQFEFNLNNKKGLFFDIPCFIPSGEEEEFLLKCIKKLK
jgi:hypothetical protein